MNGTFSGLFKVGDARSGGGEVSIVFANKHNDDLTRRRLEGTQGCGPAAFGGSFTKKSPLILAMAASVALALSGCGGGGDAPATGGDTMTGGGDTMTGTPIDVERESSEQISAIFANATRFEPSPRFFGSITYEPTYFATAPSLETQPTTLPGRDDFRAFYINKDANDNPVEYDDLTIGSSFFTVNPDDYDVGDVPDTDIDIGNVDVYAYGGWMDYNYFHADRISGSGINRETGDSTTTDIVRAYSLGSESGSNPMAMPGSATWGGAALGAIMGYQSRSGTYVGTEYHTSSNLTFNSDATIVVDFSNETLDARFDNFTISDPILHGGAVGEIDEIEFLNVRYYYGRFERGIPFTGIFPWAPTQGLELNEIKGIAGAFYGPNHEEVGGSFFATTRRPAEQVIVGAFGAERQ